MFTRELDFLSVFLERPEILVEENVLQKTLVTVFIFQESMYPSQVDWPGPGAVRFLRFSNAASRSEME